MEHNAELHLPNTFINQQEQKGNNKMGIVQREINGRALYEAMRLNGHEGYIRGEWFQFDSETGKPVAGCAVGLMAINLKVAANQSVNTNANIYAQLNTLAVPEDSKWYQYSDAETVGNAIIYWNDMTHDTNNVDRYGYPEREYELPTFEDVHQMVYDLLQPHFATTFRVDAWEWDADDFNPAVFQPVEDYPYEF